MKLLVLALLCAPLLVHAVTAKSYVVLDEEGKVLLEHNADERLPIASITKLFTAERNIKLPLGELITITAQDLLAGQMRSTALKVGQSYTRDQLMSLALVNSDNVAAIALGRSAPQDLLLPPETTYVEASGLDPLNQSTARALATFARGLYLTPIAHFTVQPTVLIGTQLRRSTNPFLSKPNWNFLFSKTGYISLAGGCLVVVMKVKDKIVSVVILGARSVRERWCDLAELRTQLGDTTVAPGCARRIEKKRNSRAHH